MENTTFKNELDSAFNAKDYKKFVQIMIDKISINALINELANNDFDLAEGSNYELKVVDGYTGYEGGGETCDAVIQVTKDAISFFFRVFGCYSSYADTEWDNEFTIVKPEQVMVTQYQDVKMKSELDQLYEQSIDEFLSKFIKLLKEKHHFYSMVDYGVELENYKFINVFSAGDGVETGQVIRVLQLIRNNTPTDVFVEFTGFNKSNDGTDWDDEYYLVEPTQVLVTQYNKI